MPTYDWTCKTCSRDSEVFQPMFRRDESHACPHCGSEETFRKVGNTPEIYIDPPFRYHGIKYEDGTGMATKKMHGVEQYVREQSSN